MSERLQKYLSKAGVASRRKSEELIRDGRVLVNGVTILEMGYKVEQGDRVTVDGTHVRPVETHEYYLINKPRGYVSTTSDDKGRRPVTDLIHHTPTRLYPVGRLDYNTTGALILTNDGAFTEKLIHPKHHVKKVYIAKIKGYFTIEKMKRLAAGVVIDGKKTAPAKVRLLSKDAEKGTYKVRIILTEGRNHQVKKMFQSVGCDVLKLHRDSIGVVNVRDLRSGEYRELTESEVYLLLHNKT